MSHRKRALSASPWSDLPRQIISKIETRLDSAIDMLHLRSVCKNWRSSRNPTNTSILSPLIPLIIPNLHLPFTDYRPCDPLCLVARAVFLVKPLQSSSDSCSWLLTVEETVPGKLRILYPLSNNGVRRLPSDFPKNLDLSKFRVSQVARSYGFKYDSDGEDVESVCRVVLCAGTTAMVLFGGGTLIGLRLKTGNWSYVRHSITCLFKDVISCGGDHVRAVDYKGHVHTIDHRMTKVVKSFKTISLAPEIHGPVKINLIRSNGELFAATCSHESHSKKFEFEIYRLDEVQCEWVDDVNIDCCSKVLFVSSDWSFFLYTHDLDLRHYSPRTNQTEQRETMSGDYVIYSEGSFTYYGVWSNTSQLYKGTSLDLRIGVYFCNKDDASFWQQAHCCSTTTIKLLWPPPAWFWPDTCLSTRDDEELDIHCQSSALHSRKVQSSSFTANASTRAGIANKEGLGAKFKAVGNSHAPAVQLSKEKDLRVSFQGIEVQSKHLPILQDVWKNHGDVFEGSILQSCGLKAMALSCLAKILIILQTPGEGFTNDQVTYVESTFADLQCMRLKIDWLVPSVETILGLHKQLQADLVALEEAKAKAEKTEDRLLAAMTELKLKP